MFGLAAEKQVVAVRCPCSVPWLDMLSKRSLLRCVRLIILFGTGTSVSLAHDRHRALFCRARLLLMFALFNILWLLPLSVALQYAFRSPGADHVACVACFRFSFSFCCPFLVLVPVLVLVLFPVPVLVLVLVLVFVPVLVLAC